MDDRTPEADLDRAVVEPGALDASLGIPLRDQTAVDALTYICGCEEAGDFAGFSPEARLQEYRDYFGA